MINEFQAMQFIRAAATCLSLCLGGAAYAQQPSELVSCKPVIQSTGENGCWILTSHPLGVSSVPVYWTLDVFPSRDLAEQAKGTHGTVVESLGKVWLLTIGEKPGPDSGGVRVTQIGPLAVEKDRSYTAQYMETSPKPGMVSKTHLHSGIEAFYTESAETCLETPSGVQIGKEGSNIVVPEGVPMELTAVGAEPRRGLILVLHDASKPPTTLVDDWKSKHLCASAK